MDDHILPELDPATYFILKSLVYYGWCYIGIRYIANSRRIIFSGNRTWNTVAALGSIRIIGVFTLEKIIYLLRKGSPHEYSTYLPTLCAHLAVWAGIAIYLAYFSPKRKAIYVKFFIWVLIGGTLI